MERNLNLAMKAVEEEKDSYININQELRKNVARLEHVINDTTRVISDLQKSVSILTNEVRFAIDHQKQITNQMDTMLYIIKSFNNQFIPPQNQPSSQK
jgi:hypothetical protein